MRKLCVALIVMVAYGCGGQQKNESPVGVPSVTEIVPVVLVSVPTCQQGNEAEEVTQVSITVLNNTEQTFMAGGEIPVLEFEISLLPPLSHVCVSGFRGQFPGDLWLYERAEAPTVRLYKISDDGSMELFDTKHMSPRHNFEIGYAENPIHISQEPTRLLLTFTTEEKDAGRWISPCINSVSFMSYLRSDGVCGPIIILE